MTVQEIQEIGFEKAVFGGYDMKSVDTFLERVAEEFAAMQKENASLKAKMKVLVDKIEEYRGVEDGMRRTLMSAQSIAQDTIDKAKKEAESIVAAAKTETETKVQDTEAKSNWRHRNSRRLARARSSSLPAFRRLIRHRLRLSLNSRRQKSSSSRRRHRRARSMIRPRKLRSLRPMQRKRPQKKQMLRKKILPASSTSVN